MSNKFNIRSLVQKKYMLKIILAIFTTCLLLLSYKLIFATNKKQADTALKIVEIQAVKADKIQQTVRLIGTIRPKHVTVLIAKSTGMLDSLLATGQHIKKGMLIAKIDNPDIEKNLQLSETAEKIAQKQYDRLFTVFKSGIVSSKEVEEKKQAWIESQRDLAKTKIELDTIRFYAPFDGIIGAYKKREGTQVRQGDPIVTIYDPSALVVDFDIPCTNLTTISEGQSVHVLNADYHLNHIQKMIDDETHMCPAEVDIVCENCVIGSNVDVELVVQEKEQAIVIPYEALFFRNGAPFVYLVEEEKVALIPVKIGLKEKSQIEITAGLKVGQKLIIRGQERLYPTMQVAINQPTTASVSVS